MGESFARTTRSLRADRGGGWLLALVLGTGLLAVWCGWMGLARVPVRSVSVRARIESALVPRDVQAAVAGVVTEIPVRLGDRVSQGDPIVRLDDADARSARTDAAARVDGLRSQIERLSLVRDALAGVTGLDASARSSAAAAARADADQGRVAADQAEEEAARAGDLAAQGAISTQELERARTEARRLRLEASGRESVFRQLASERAGAAQGGEANVGRIEQELADLRSRLAGAVAQLAAADTALGRHLVVAPVDGAIGSLAVVDVGRVVAVGDPIATVVPSGALRAVASFTPASALGRIRPGQTARMRLDGFPWTSFGTIPAIVERVADEPDADDTIRVELALTPDADGSPAAVPLQHGLPGVVEVDVERVAPAALVLRAAGGGS